METVEARSRDRLQYLENTLARRMEAEKRDISDVLDELAGTIEKELAEVGKPKQGVFDLFEEEELEQVRKDTNALRRRLERIPEEKRREIGAIERRYSGFESRTFPVAVTFVLPKSHARGGRS